MNIGGGIFRERTGVPNSWGEFSTRSRKGNSFNPNPSANLVGNERNVAGPNLARGYVLVLLFLVGAEADQKQKKVKPKYCTIGGLVVVMRYEQARLWGTSTDD